MKRATPKRVDPITEPEDFQAALMASYGISAKTISANTHLTNHQVRYRLHRFGIKLSGYRNGAGLGARSVMQHGRQMIGYQLEQELKQKMGIK